MLAWGGGLCYDTYNSVGSFRPDKVFEGTALYKGEDVMLIEVDFNSSEAIYIQLRNQIIMGIATDMIREGDTLPSVRQMADHIGINMHTVNKAYSVLRQEGFVKLDRRKGAVVSLDVDKIQAIEEMRQTLDVVLACGICRDVSREEAHQLVDEIYDRYTKRDIEARED